jgi:hypothetical protein
MDIIGGEGKDRRHIRFRSETATSIQKWLKNPFGLLKSPGCTAGFI